jgi:hypothetical protein
LEHREVALGAFIDGGGAYDRISFEVMTKVATQHRLQNTMGQLHAGK